MKEKHVYKKKQVDHNVIRCKECVQDKRSICHETCLCGFTVDKCDKFDNDNKLCSECGHNVTDHEICKEIFEIGKELDKVDLKQIKGEYKEKLKDLSVDRKLIYKYVTEIEKQVGELEMAQLKIKDCDDFLSKNAARKQAFFESSYYQEQIDMLEKEQE